MFEALLGTLSAAFILWDDKQKADYQNKLVSLKEGYYAEYNKAPDVRSDAVLDDYESQLRILASSWAAGIGKPNS